MNDSQIAEVKVRIISIKTKKSEQNANKLSSVNMNTAYQGFLSQSHM